MDKNIFCKLKDIYCKLQVPFPYKDTEKLYNDFNDMFIRIEFSSFNADFNQYCMVVAGTLSYILNQKWAIIPEKQIDLLQYNFFELYKCYGFIKNDLEKYVDLNRMYLDYEDARKHILQFLKET